jgi:hypothetical protein
MKLLYYAKYKKKECMDKMFSLKFTTRATANAVDPFDPSP